MQSPTLNHRLAFRAGIPLALVFALAVRLPAQNAPASNDQTAPTKSDETVVLSPFEVRTEKDSGYGALNSNTVTLFSVDLQKTPIAADIFTEQFMEDVATTNVEDLLNGYGAGAGAVLATPDSDSNNNQPGDRFSVAQMGSRGLSAGDVRYNGFVASSTRTSGHDTFDVERVEQVKGGNATLYGSSGVGGYTNTVAKRPKFGQSGRPNSTGSVSLRVDQFGSQRWVTDLNYGLKNVAVRFVMLDEEQKYRRLFLGARTLGYYGTVAVKLPHNSVLRLTGRKTDNDRIISTRIDNLSFTSGTQRDPRQNFSLLYMLATNQAGANNPKTGLPYQGTATNPVTGQLYQMGPIANGLLDYSNASSWSGWAQSEDISTDNYTAVLESVWTKWFSTQIGAMYDGSWSQRGPDGGTLTPPKTFNSSNPFDDWANNSSMRMDRNSSKRWAYRASAVLTNDLFGNRAHSQTVLGWDADKTGSGNTNYRYYEADANFNVYDSTNPRPAGIGSTAGGTTAANGLGRWELGTIWWPVGGGPIKKPAWRIGSREVTIGGKNYVLLQQNPRNPAWITANNPLGLATLSGVPGLSGVGGANLGNYASKQDFWGLYGANYTRWMDDRLTTLLGYRISHSTKTDPNTSSSGVAPFTETDKNNKSFSVGGNYRIKPWMYAYYNISQTFLPAKGSNDPYGRQPEDTEGLSQEVGLKYEGWNGKVSGSIAYYWAKQNNDNFNYGTTVRDLINPVGLNDAFNSAFRNQWVSLDKQSSGLEVILSATPTRNLSMRLGFTQQDGKINTASAFPMLWNDEFFYNKSTGGVTYADGSPFVVPTDTAGITAVGKLSSAAAPVVGTTNTQLTLTMMSDPTNSYYVYQNASGIPLNGQITTNNNVWRALRWFQTTNSSGQIQQSRTLRPGQPVTAIPYYYPDPAGYKGVYQVSEKGEPVVGNPLYRFVFDARYDFTRTWLKGLTLGGGIVWDIDKRTYWYREPVPGSTVFIRKLYKEVSINPQVNPFFRYTRKFRRLTFSTQVNVNNLLNRYKVDLRPDVSTGFSNEANIGATFVGEPRSYVWTNTVRF
jgi:outer membrane receptor protein involved in Fe transport